MNSGTTTMREGGDDAQAAEYILHLLSPLERSTFEARLDVEGNLRATVAEWGEYFVGFADDIPEVAPPPAIRANLERAVRAASWSRRPERTAPARGLSLWRMLTGAGLAAALGIAVMTQLPQVQLPGIFTPAYVAQISEEGGALLLNVGYSVETGELRVERGDTPPPEGRVYQLWAIADGSPGPVSLGVLPESGRAVLSVPQELRATLPGATLAISDEPPGGSPDPGPSGEVRGTASLSDV